VEKGQVISINNINEVSGSSDSDTLMASEMKDAIDGLAGNDVFQVSLAALTAGDVLVGGNDVDRINFSGGSASQLLSIDLGSANQLVGLSNPGISGDSPLLSQFEQVSLATFAGRGILIGDTQNNLLIGSAQKDTLTGNAGADTFALASLTHSLLTNFDVITDYGSQDRIDSPTPAVSLNASSGNATTLTSAAIAAVLRNSVFPANSARAFTVTNQPGVFLALNNGIAGFNSGTDALLHLSNYSLNAANPVTVL
jgi:Ca2+-binding RTX toxin-like protein